MSDSPDHSSPQSVSEMDHPLTLDDSQDLAQNPRQELTALDDSDDTSHKTDDETMDEESELDQGHPLFDLEATESRDDQGSADETGSDAYDVYGRLTYNNNRQDRFPQFLRLPIELRHMIWVAFDSDLKSKGRVFELHIRTKKQSWKLVESAILSQQTAPARAMLATHRESRALALQHYPDTLSFGSGPAVTRINRQHDVILFSADPCDLGQHPVYTGQIVSEDVIHVAIDCTEYSDFSIYSALMPRMMNSPTEFLLSAFPNMKHFYCCETLDYRGTPNSAPSGLPIEHHFQLQSDELEPGLGESVTKEYTWCYAQNPEWAAPLTMYPSLKGRPHFKKESAAGVELWPMVCRYDFADRGAYLGGASSRSEVEDDEYDSESIDDEYDSEGIDDESLGDSEVGDDDVVVTDDDSDGTAEASVFEGISPLRSTDSTGEDAFGAAEFSSPEQEPAGEPGHDDSETEEPVRGAQRAKRRTVLSDSEDEASSPVASKRRRLSAPLESKDGGVEEAKAGDDEPSDETLDEDSDQGTRKSSERMSLADRLALFRSEVSVRSSEPESGAETVDGESLGDYDPHQSDDFQDDDQDEGLQSDDDVALDLEEEPDDELYD